MSRIISFGVLIIFAVLSVTNGNGNGCEWSGCQEFATSPCKTGVTGGSGRHNLYKTKSCGFFGRKDFCCDDDCGYIECGTVHFGTKYTNEVARMQCGVASQQSFKEFVCGANGVIPPGISYRIDRRNNGFRNTESSFRSTDNNSEVENGGFSSSNDRGGFRNNGFRNTGTESSFRSTDNNSEIENGGFRSSNDRGGFRTISETPNDTNREVSNGGFRSNGNGFRTA